MQLKKYSNMDSKCYIPLQLKREIGLYSHSPSSNNELCRLAEDKAALRDSQEINCQLPGNPRSTFLMVFSPDGTKIASTHGDHHIYVSDVKTGKCLHTLEGHPRTPWCIAFHPSSNEILASGCLGGEVRVWDLHGGSEVWMTQQNSVIASLAFHPFDQVLVIATFNELHFWDWSQPQPFACCKTSSEREKVRYIKFDLLGHKLITGIANLPVVQSTRSEATRSMADRYASLMEHYNRILDVRRGQRQQQTPATQNTGTDPIATNERPTSPTQAEALQSARDYARAVTSDNLQYNRLLEEPLAGTSSSEEFDRNAWRYQDPMQLREPSAPSGLVPAMRPSSQLGAMRDRDSGLGSSSESNSLTEMSLPSSLIQALVRLQRSLEVLTQSRVNAASDRNSSEQVYLRQRIEEILNRLFNLYASITPLRILMDEVFQDVDREAVLAEVNRDPNGSSLTGQSDLDIQIQELRQQLTRLLERILGSEMDRSNQLNAPTVSLPSTSSTSPSAVNQSEVAFSSGVATRFTITPRFVQPLVWDQPLLVNYPRNVLAFRRHSNNEQGTATGVDSSSSSSISNTNQANVDVRRPATDSTVHLRLCVMPNPRQTTPDGSETPRTTLHSSSCSLQPAATTSGGWLLTQNLGTNSANNQSASSAATGSAVGNGSTTASTLNRGNNNLLTSMATGSLQQLPQSHLRSSTPRGTLASQPSSFTPPQQGGLSSGVSSSSSAVSTASQPPPQEQQNAPLLFSLSTETPPRTTMAATLQIPRFQIDPAEPAVNDGSDATNEPVTRIRPRSPPLSSMVNMDQAAGRQVIVDYQAATASNSAPGGRVPGGSLFLHPNYVASLFEESLQRTNALQLVINRAIAGTFLGTAEFAVVNNVMSLTHRIQWWDFSRLRIPDISDCRRNVVVPECKIHNDASVDISSDGNLLAVLVPGTVGLPSTTVVSLYSLEKRNIGTCLYSYYFGPNAISVSLSPLSRYIVVGLASRRVTVAPNEKQVVAQVFRLIATKETNQGNLELIRNIEQGGSNRMHVSLNSIRWLPHPGQGIVYGTNRGDLKICRPGPSKEDEPIYTKLKVRPNSHQHHVMVGLRSMQGHSVQSTSTQTVSPQTQSAGTQTGLDLETSDVTMASTSSAAH